MSTSYLHEPNYGTASAPWPYVVTVYRPDRDELHYGFATESEARTVTDRFTAALDNTAHVPGTLIDWTANTAGIDCHPPVPAEPTLLAPMIEATPDSDHAERFPDLYTRLTAQLGSEANRVWQRACILADQEADYTEAVNELGTALGAVEKQLRDVAGQARILAEDGTDGEDVAAYVADAARAIRAAKALHERNY